MIPGNSNSRGFRHFWPPLEQALIPMKRDDLPWQPVADKPHEFQHGDSQQKETIKLDFFFRLLDPVTNRYVEALHCFQLLKDMDPNDSTWKDKYNWTINQWRSRRDAEFTKLRRWE